MINRPAQDNSAFHAQPAHSNPTNERNETPNQTNRPVETGDCPHLDAGRDSFVIGLEDAGDGLYSAAFESTYWAGDYEVGIDIYGISSLGFWFSRSPSATFNVSDPVLPFVTVEDNWMFEQNSGTHDVTFAVALSEPAAVPITIEYATKDNTAKRGLDYREASGSIALEPGETTATISVPVIGNMEIQSNRTFLITLSNPSNATLGRAQAVGTIIDDDVFVRVTAGEGDLLAYVDLHGTRVSVEVTNAAADAWFSGSNIEAHKIGSTVWVTGENLGLEALFLNGTSVNTTLRFNVSGGTNRSSIGNIYADGTVRMIVGPKMDLRGSIQILGGLIRRLVLGDVVGPLSIVIGSSAESDHWLLMEFGRVNNLSVTSETRIKSISAIEWVNSGSIEEVISASMQNSRTPSTPLASLALIAAHWLRDDCVGTDGYDGADLNADGRVDFRDFAVLAEDWTE